MPYMKFLFVRSDVCLGLPSDSTLRWTPLPLTMQFPLLGLARDFHPLDNAHAERTKKRVSKKYLAPSIYSYPYWRLKSNIRFYKGVFCLFGHPLFRVVFSRPLPAVFPFPPLQGEQLPQHVGMVFPHGMPRWHQVGTCEALPALAYRLF